MGRIIFTGKHSTFTNAKDEPNQPLEDKLNCREDASWGYMGLPGILAGEIENDWIKRFNNQTDDFIWEHKGTLSRNDAILKQFGFPTNEIVKKLLYAESRMELDRALIDANTPVSKLRGLAEYPTAGISDYRTPLIRLTDQQLLDRAFFTVLISKYGRDIKEHFKSKKGGVRSHGTVDFISGIKTNKANFLRAINDKVGKHYKRRGGFFPSIDVSEEVSNNMLSFRDAFMDKSLMIAFGGIQEIEVKGTLVREEKVRVGKYEKPKDITQLTVDIHVTIRDWYGVDEEDVYKNAFAANIDREGLACLWILQHQRGYPPFINKIEHVIKKTVIHVVHD